MSASWPVASWPVLSAPWQESVVLFQSLFAGNPRAYGLRSGGSQRGTIWPKMRGHLEGEEAIGIYPIDPSTGLVRWGCVDIDRDDLEAAENLQGVLAFKGITSWIERSKGKGYHVWVFSPPVAARTMRRALLVAKKVAGLDWVPEVNPKQEELAFDQLGNYVNLPYPREREPGRQVIIGPPNPPIGTAVWEKDEYTWPLNAFAPEAWRTRASVEQLESLAVLWQEQRRTHTERVLPVPATNLHRNMNGLAWTMWKDGPLADKVTGRIDRSRFLAHLAHELRDTHTASEAFVLLKEADARLAQPKFANRVDGDEQLWRIVENAY